MNQLEHSRHARSRLCMPYIRFRSANTEMSKVLCTGAAARRCERASLDGVTQCGACAVRLEIGDTHLEGVRAGGA
eukprot:1725414-Prymnesium_polylepis.1